MQLHVGMHREEVLYALRPVRREVVQDDAFSRRTRVITSSAQTPYATAGVLIVTPHLR